MTFCVTRVSTCCTHTSGWAGCRCRPCCRVGIVATRLLEHSSCLGTFPTSLPSVPTTLLGGAGAVLDWGPGARLRWALLGVCGPLLLSCPSVFSPVGTPSNSCALCCRTDCHAVCNMWGAILCAPDHMEGTQDMVCLLACQERSLGAPLLSPQLSPILVLGRRASCWR